MLNSGSCVEIGADSNFELAYVPDSADRLFGKGFRLEFYNALRSGSQLVEGIAPGTIAFCRDECPNLPLGAFTLLSGSSCFLVTREVMQALVPVAGDAAAFYPMEVEGLERYLMHTLAQADAVDESRSILKKFSSGKIMIAKHLFLRHSIVEQHTFFQLANGPAGLFAYGEAARVLLDHQFSGVELIEVELS